jgi:phosphatidate cytidylyltransferase
VLRLRLASSAVLVPVVAAVFLLGRPWLDALVLLIAALGAWEAFGLLRAAGYRSFRAYGSVLAVACVVAGGVSGMVGYPVGIPVLGALLAGVGAFGPGDPRDGLATWLGTVFGALYVGLLAFVLVLLVIPPPLPAGAPLATLGAGRGWVLALVATVWAYDSFAYAFGRAFGRRRFLEHISPSKTYAGLFGGILGAVLVAAAVMVGLGRSPAEGVVVGVLVGLAAQAGDLAESMLKRAAGAKDSGRLIPGHGGMLDRVDSFLFAAPVLAAYVALVSR